MTKKLTIHAAVGYAILALFCFVSLLPIWMAFKIALTWPTDVFASAGSPFQITIPARTVPAT